MYSSRLVGPRRLVTLFEVAPLTNLLTYLLTSTHADRQQQSFYHQKRLVYGERVSVGADLKNTTAVGDEEPFCFLFLCWRDWSATAGRIFTKSSEKTSLRYYSLMVVLHWKSVFQNFGAQNVHFWAKIQTPPSSNGSSAETRRNSGKAKTTDISTISKLPSNPRLVKLDSGLISCAFWLTDLSASLDRQYLENCNAYRITK